MRNVFNYNGKQNWDEFNWYNPIKHKHVETHVTQTSTQGKYYSDGVVFVIDKHWEGRAFAILHFTYCIIHEY